MILRTIFLLSIASFCFAKDVTEILQIVRCGTMENLKKAFEDPTDVNARNSEGITPILYAARENRGDMLLYFALTQRANILTVDQDKRNILHWAVIKGNVAIIQIIEGNLRKQKPKLWRALVQAKDGTGLTPFHWAAQRGNKEIVTLLLQSGVDPNIGDADGKTALYWASKKGHRDIVQILIGSRLVDVNHKSPWGMTALHESVRGGHVDAVEELLKAGADINALDVDERTPLYWASERGYAKVVDMLLDKGANPSLSDQDKRSPLHRAARYGHTDVVSILVQKGKIPVDIQDTLQETPLCWAVLNGHIETTKMLVSLGAKLEYLKRGDHSIFHELAAKGQNEMIQFLASKGYNVNQLDAEGKTALDYAASSGKASTVNLLMHDGAASEQGVHSEKALDYAFGQGRDNTEAAEVLLNGKRDDIEALKKLIASKKKEIYKVDSKDKSIFEYALIKGHIKLLTILVLETEIDKTLALLKNKRLNLNILDIKDHLSMLHYAALMHKEALAESLLKAGADPNVKESKTNFTPLHYAILEKYTPVLDVLLKAHASISPQDKFEAIKSGFRDAVKAFLENGMTSGDYLGGKTILDILTEQKNTQVIELFLDYFKGDPKSLDKFDRDDFLKNMQDDAGMTVAHWVAKSGGSGLLDVLLDHSKMATPLFIAGIDKTGRTPLHYAAAGGYPDIVEKLLAEEGGGLDIDTLSDDGTSALHEAAIHKQIPTVKKLLALKANKDLLDKHKKTAFDYLKYLDDKTKIELGMMSPPPPATSGKPAKKSTK